jgi:hypothetical protein
VKCIPGPLTVDVIVRGQHHARILPRLARSPR